MNSLSLQQPVSWISLRELVITNGRPKKFFTWLTLIRRIQNVIFFRFFRWLYIIWGDYYWICTRTTCPNLYGIRPADSFLPWHSNLYWYNSNICGWIRWLVFLSRRIMCCNILLLPIRLNSCHLLNSIIFCSFFWMNSFKINSLLSQICISNDENSVSFLLMFWLFPLCE